MSEQELLSAIDNAVSTAAFQAAVDRALDEIHNEMLFLHWQPTQRLYWLRSQKSLRRSWNKHRASVTT